MFYRLKEPWSLRGYEKQLLLLERWGENETPRVLTGALFSLLSRCDGTTCIDTAAMEEPQIAALERYEQMGVIEKLSEPQPVRDYQNYRHIPNRRISTVFWGITGRCNMRCRHCFMAADIPHEVTEFSLDGALRAIDRFVECGIRNVILSGGEPLLHPNFPQIVEAIGNAGMRVVRLFTNGLLLSRETLDCLKNNGMSPELVISFDGLGHHDWMRGVSGAEDAAVRAVKLSVSNGFSVRAAINMNAVTLPSLEETGRYLYDLGVRSLFFLRTSEAPRWLALGIGTLTPDEYFEAVVNLISALRPLNKRGLELSFFNGMTLPPNASAEALDVNFKVYHSPEVPESAWCGKCINTVFVSGAGNVLPCDGFEGGALEAGFLSEGCNIHERPLKDILTDSPYAEQMRISVADILDANPECMVCEWRDKCHGGVCRACGAMFHAAQLGGFHGYQVDIKRKAPLACTMFKGGYYERILKLLRET